MAAARRTNSARSGSSCACAADVTTNRVRADAVRVGRSILDNSFIGEVRFGRRDGRRDVPGKRPPVYRIGGGGSTFACVAIVLSSRRLTRSKPGQMQAPDVDTG